MGIILQMILLREEAEIARMVGHITYLSDESMKEKFDRDLKEENWVMALMLISKLKLSKASRRFIFKKF
ncbi:MAG: hypothetical protein Ct9H90mP4_10710 [Gammaproteobacteria bacterium]|nr:MAG: hypothetical protein Ct9H90mP4_10710 [Gammaproteobacteria bacterium]